MKKLIILFIVLMGLVSCSKNDVYCWDCITEVEADDFYSSHRFEVCGLTYDERADFEKANSEIRQDFSKRTSCKVQQ